MDNVTHALAGLLLAEATVTLVERRSGAPAADGLRAAAAVLGVVAAELPDLDLLYAGPVLGMGKLGYLLHHRGHTHTIVFAVVAALALWGATLWLRRAARSPAEKWALLGLAMAGTLSHIALDYTNSYGVHPFWPVENSWHYGDAVFIVEPWLWVVAIPPLVLLSRNAVLRLALAVALVGILVAAWRVDMVANEVAIALTIGAAAWSAAALVAPPSRRVALALGAWLVVEGAFFAAAGVARAEVRAAMAGPGSLRDVVLNPAVGDPLCFRALAVEVEGDTYRVTSAAVAPLPALRAVSRCSTADLGADISRPSPRAGTRSVRWGSEASGSRIELSSLAANCVIDAALRFVRVPAWRRAEGGGLELFDLRYGEGGFADVVAPERPRECPRPVPPWEPPRDDVLRGA